MTVWLSRVALLLALGVVLAGTCSETECDFATDPSCTSSTTTSITSDDPDPSIVGQVVRIEFSVTSSNGPPVGRIEITLDDAGVERCSASVEFGGCEIKIMSPGAKKIRARYLDSAGFTGSNDTEEHRVEKATTTTAIITDDPDPSVVGEAIEISYRVAVDAPGTGVPSGRVRVNDGTDGCVGTVKEGSCRLKSTGTGTKMLTVAYSGDGRYEASSTTGSHEVTIAATTTRITSHSPDPSLVGEAVDVGFSVDVNPPGEGLPTGLVTVTDGVETCSADVSRRSCALTLNVAGEQTLTVTYEGDDDFAGSSASQLHQVASAPSLVTLSDEPDPSAVGEPVFVSFEVTSPGGTPTGTVTVSVDDSSGEPCTAEVQEGGCEITLTSAGAKTLTATYSGDSNFVGSEGSEPHQVDRAQTSTSILGDDPDPSVVGGPVDVGFSVTVLEPGSGTPTGNVTATDGTDSCSAAVETGACTITFTTAGDRTLTVTYEGDEDFESSSDTQNHEVTAATTTLTFTDDPDPSLVGEPVTVSFDVTSDGGTPTGPVIVTVDDTSGDTCSAEVADGSCQLTLTTAGSKTLTVSYEGDGNHGPSEASDAHQVEQAVTFTAITSDEPDPSAVGQAIDVQYAVTVESPGSGRPTGDVTVSDGTDSCTGSVADGACTLVPLSAGSKTLTATYEGDADFLGSSGTEAHEVSSSATAITLSDDPDPSVVGEPVTVTFEVEGEGSGAPTGTVTVTVGDGSGASCSADVALGECDITLTSAGAKVLTAAYSGDVNFLPGTATEAHQVNLAQTTTTITSDDPDPSMVGEDVTVVYSVTVDAPGSGTPTGIVTVTDGTDSCIGTVEIGSCTLDLNIGGAVTLTATYEGDANFESSSGTESHQVDRAATTTIVTGDDPDPSLLGEVVSVEFLVTSTAGQPTGTVTVTVDDVSGATCSATVEEGVCDITLTTAGAVTLTASYEGDANFDLSSDDESHQVDPAVTTTAITLDDPDPSVVGEPVTVEFSVTSSAVTDLTPTGNVTVTVDDGSGASCTGTVSDGVCEITLTSVGSKTLTASYEGDVNFDASSGTATHDVDQAQTTTTITSDEPDPSDPGVAIVVFFTVIVDAPGSGTPTGVVTVTDGTASCITTVEVGSCELTPIATGGFDLTVTYAGDANFASSSGTEHHTVTGN